MTRSKALFGSGLLAAWAALASPAIAGDVASEFGLGTVQGFDNEEAARTHCQGDGVVWVDRKTGFYYPKFAPECGAGRTGAFACFKDAKKADYWGPSIAVRS